MSRSRVLKIISNVLILLSLVFLTGYLIKNHQLVLLKIENIPFLVLSLIFLFGGLFFEAVIMKIYLGKNGIHVNYLESLIMSGKYILAKYIPGKFGIVLGKAVFLSEKGKTTTKIALQKIFLYQIFFLVTSFFISILPLYGFLFSSSRYIIWIILLMAAGIVIFSQPIVQVFFLNLLKRLTKRDFGEPVSREATMLALILSLISWSFWSVGFYFLACSFGFDIPFRTGFLFPLASLAGILVLISPGGLGVREGIILLGLLYYRVPKDQAISLSAYSRLWFVAGEVALFMVAMILDKYFMKVNENENKITE